MRRRNFLRSLAGTGALAGASALSGCGSSSDADADAAFYVSPDGDDEWSGERPEPAGDDGPFRTIERAQRAVRERDWSGREEPVRVLLRDGTYRREEPLQFAPADSGTPDAPVTYAAYPGEEPVVSGGRRIDGWEATTANGVDAWRTTVPEVADDDWYPRQLFVNGERRRRPILPERTAGAFRDGEAHSKEEWGLLPVEGVPAGVEQSGGFRSEKNKRLVTDAVDPDWRNLGDVEFVLCNRWMDEHARIDAFDPATGEVALSNRTFWGRDVTESAFYLVNVFEALSDPGEWYLDRGSGELWYVPREGETVDDVDVIAPVADRLLETAGTGEDAYLSDVRFRGLAFRHARWRFQPDNTSDSQGESIPAAVHLEGARRCRFERCRFEHLGQYALELGGACRECGVAGCGFVDLGAGAVQAGQRTERDFAGSVASTPEWRRTRENQFVDNHVRRYGRVFHRGVAFLVENAARTQVDHNHVHDAYHSGVTAGGQMGYDGGVDGDNRFAHNHVHDVGKGLLSDFGGVYVRGSNPGTVVRSNRIHDVYEYDYGGNGLYGDLGCTGVRWVGNLVHDVERGFNLHWGRDLTLANNVLARARTAAVSYANDRGPSGTALRVRRNVLATADAPLFAGGYDRPVAEGSLESDRNLLWDAGGAPTFGEPSSGIQWRLRRSGDPIPLDFRYAAGDGTRTFVTDVGSPGAGPSNPSARLVGYGVVVGDRPLEVTHLGRYVFEGNDGTHRVRLWDADAGAFVATATVDAAAGSPGSVEYAELEAPVTLAAGGTYYLVSTERPAGEGGDAWATAPLSTADVARVRTAVAAVTGTYDAASGGDLEWWRRRGFDERSIVAAPSFRDPGEAFTLAGDSPALEPPVDLEPLATDDAGVREAETLRPRWPPGVTATLTGAGDVRLEWTAVPGAAAYVIERASRSDRLPAFETVAAGVDGTAHVDESAPVGGEFAYAVRTVAGDRTSDRSPEQTVETNPPPADLAVAVDGDAGDPALRLTWAASPVADAYVVYRAAAREGPYERVTRVPEPGVEVATPDAGERRYYAVTAVTEGRESEPSEETVVTAVRPGAGLRTHFPFDGDAATDAVRGNDGRLRGGVTTGVPGRIGRAFGFDGTGGLVDAGTATAFDPAPPFAAALWFRADAWAGDHRRLLDRGAHGGAGFQGFAVFALEGSGRLVGRYGDAAGRFFDTVGPRPSTGEWHHAAYVVERGRQRLFLDGERVAASAHEPAVAYEAAPLHVGAHTGGAQFFDGRIDDVRLYGRALSPTEVRALASVD